RERLAFGERVREAAEVGPRDGLELLRRPGAREVGDRDRGPVSGSGLPRAPGGLDIDLFEELAGVPGEHRPIDLQAVPMGVILRGRLDRQPVPEAHGGEAADALLAEDDLLLTDRPRPLALLQPMWRADREVDAVELLQSHAAPGVPERDGI